jgi:predicted metalloprotease with PDZ domain
MRHPVRCSALVVLAIAAAAVLAGARQADDPVQYRVSFPAPEHHYAQVEVTFSGVPLTPLEARMSRSSPGRYAVHEFAKNVFDLQAFDGAGRKLTPTRPHASQWNVAGHDGTVRILYKVFGNRVDGTYLAVDASHAHMNMPATLMWARGLDVRPVRVSFVVPAGRSWKAATQLFPTADPLTFTAPNFQYLMDSPAELSDHAVRAFTVRNPDGREFTIRIALHHDADASAVDAYAAATEKIVRESAAVFGEYPSYDTGTYTFLGDYLPWGGGDGMEHRNSTVVASTTSLSTPAGVRAVLATVAHEFFHGWNVERIRPLSLEPFSFEDANVSGELWLAEGFTQYYAPLILARAGLSPDEQGAGLAAPALAIINAPGRRFRSAVEMSQMAAFTDAAAAIDETNFSNTFISYYTYGAALAVALDLSLRDRSGGRITLDDFMRAMWREHGKPGGPAPGLVASPYTLRDARDRLAEVSGDPRFAAEFFERYIEGRELPDYARLLSKAGLLLRKRHPGAPWAGMLEDGAPTAPARRGPETPAGEVPGTDAAAGIIIPDLVAWGSPAFNAGLEAADVIIAVDGRRIASVEQWRDAIRPHKPGDALVVAFSRHGTPGRTTLVLGEDPSLEVVTVESTGTPLTADQHAFRAAWLGSRQR